ncbi:MAG: hypothetical protein WCL02_07180 [bacterium]
MRTLRALSMVIVLLFTMASCQKDQDITPAVPSTTVDTGTPDPGDSGQQLKAASSMVEYAVSPRFGKPNSTYYLFKVYSLSSALGISVKLYDKATGTITYISMPKIGNYYTLSTKLSTNSWFEYRYVYTTNKSNISSTTYDPLCNSKNTFSSSGTSSIGWPFGADGSNWSNRTSQIWKGGEETKDANNPYGSHVGYGWNEGTHKDYDEKYSDDWNRGSYPTQDLGAIIQSPLDGYIDTWGTYTTSFGSSKYVAIIQEASDGNLYRFYVGHLQNYSSNLYVGKYVRTGIDQIGTLGSSGASSPHAHTNLRKVTNGDRTSVPFKFNAQ